MKILIIDNNIEEPYWGAAPIRRLCREVHGAQVLTRRGPMRDISKVYDFDCLILSGSKTSPLENSDWIDDEIALIKNSIDSGKKILAICFGHQIMARALGGIEIVGKAPKPEFGWTKIIQIGHSKLFDGLEREFISLSTHFDEVHSAPKGCTLTAKSKDCGVQAYELEGKPVFGVQFHPERSVEEAEAAFSGIKKIKNPPEILYEKEGKSLYDPRVGELIFRNFFSL